MYAQDLRKWRSVLMYLYQLYLILFSFWWLGASAMHMTPASQASAHRSDWLRSPRSLDSARGPLGPIGSSAVLQQHSQPPSPPSSYSLSSVLRISNIGSSSIRGSNSHLGNSNFSLNQITHLHQIHNNNNNLNHHNNAAALAHAPPPLPVAQALQSLQRIRPAALTPATGPLVGPHPVTSTLSAVRRKQYDAYSKRQWERKHMRADDDDMTFRNRRDSRLSRRKKKRYCSAQDPQVLAFEAPTVIEAKVRSRSNNRSSNYSVVFEHIKTYKHDPGFSIPNFVRLNFVNRNKTVCNIFNEEFRDVGFVRRSPDIGGHYILFLKQLDLGNFTILGAPIVWDDKVEKAVIRAVSNNYGEYQFLCLFVTYFRSNEEWLPSMTL